MSENEGKVSVPTEISLRLTRGEALRFLVFVEANRDSAPSGTEAAVEIVIDSLEQQLLGPE